MLQLGGWTRQPRQCSHPTAIIPWFRVSVYCQLKQPLKRCGCPVCGLIEVIDFRVENAGSVSHCSTLKGLKTFHVYLSSADSHFNLSKPRANKFSMPESSVYQILPVGSETSTNFRVVDFHFCYVETNVERLNTLLKAFFEEFVKIEAIRFFL